MNINDLRPAKDFALRYGVKAICYGPAGSGKTPVAGTAPRPLMLMTEPGMLSMRTSEMATFPAFNIAAINEFFTWISSSKEVSNFDTICIDSVSQMCEIILSDELNKNKDGRKAYGELSRKVMEKLNVLYFMPQKHLFLICKEQNLDGNRRPFFPGQDLPVKIPHLFDAVLRLAIHNVPTMGQVKAFRCIGAYDEAARDRTGNLLEFEPPHFGNLITKAMS